MEGVEWPDADAIEDAVLRDETLRIGPFEVHVSQDMPENWWRAEDLWPPVMMLNQGQWESVGGYALSAPFETIPDPGNMPRERMERVMAALGVDVEEYADFLERSGIDGSEPFSQTEVFEEFVDVLLTDMRGLPATTVPGASCDEYLDALEGVYGALGLPAKRFSVVDSGQRQKTECLVVLTAGWVARTFEDRVLPPGQLATEVSLLSERMHQYANGEVFVIEVRDGDGTALDRLGGLWGLDDVVDHVRDCVESVADRQAETGLEPG